MSYKRFSPVFILLLIVVLSIACSKSDSPIIPSEDYSSGISQDLPESNLSGNSNRTILALYDAVIDPVNQTFTIEPSSRNLSYHGALTVLYPDVLTITDHGWSPNFWADIKLTHPLPNSGIIVFDPRVIAILPAYSNVSFNYPDMNCVGNNKSVLEPDGYTKLYDSLGGSIPGNTNPFKAYFKTQPNRRWMDKGTSSETQRWHLDIHGLPVPFEYKLVVDISTNYPQSPTPVVDNASEPVAIDAVVGDGLTELGGDADITVTLFDWQGRMGVGGVLIESPSLFDRSISLGFAGPGPNPNEYIYTGTITNEKYAPAGEYSYLVAAWDLATGIYIYDEFALDVETYSPSGNLIWAKRAGGTDVDRGNGITTLTDNSTVVTGCFFATATFGEGEPKETILVVPPTGGDEMFIARYNHDGTLAWAKQAGEPGGSRGLAITALSDDSAVVTGYFRGAAIFGQGERNETTLISAGEEDIFVACYNPDGTLEWAKRAGGVGYYDNGFAITALSDNSTVITGFFDDTAIFGQGEPNQTSLTTDGYNSVFIARYNPSGTLAWAKRAVGTGSAHGFGITSLSDDSIVVTGEFRGTIAFAPDEPNETFLWSVGSRDIFMARYNPTGTLAWAKRVCEHGGENGSITTLPDDSTVMTGGFGQSTTFGLGEPNQTTLTSAGQSDIFIARFNPDSTLAWVKRAGGDQMDSGYGITSLSDNSTVVTGEIRHTVTFGEGEPNETTITCPGLMFNPDIFIARYNSNGTFAWVKHAGGTENDYGEGITRLYDNSIVVTGNFLSIATFGEEEPNETILTSAGNQDFFIARFEP